MLDALMYAVRDQVRGANIGYGIAECEVTGDGKPPPRCGNFFAAVHDGKDRADSDNNLDERFSFCVTLTARLVAPLDRIGDQQMFRNLARVPLGERQGFRARIDRLRALLHMNWKMTVQVGQTPNSANDNLAAWATGTVYGFVEPARYKGATITLVGDDWFEAEPTSDAFTGMVSELTFEGARRMQPQTLSTGSFT